MSAPTTSFRTAADAERSQRSAEVVSNRQAKVDAARAALVKVEAACIDDPTEQHFKKANEARRLLDDVERDLVLASSHAAKVEGEIAAAEARAIAKEIAKYPAPEAPVIGDEERALAVEIGMLSARLIRRIEERVRQRIDERTEVNGLLARIGETAPPVPSEVTLKRVAMEELAELGLAAQMHLGLRSRAAVDSFASAHGSCIPLWRSDGTPWVKEFDPERPNEITQVGTDRFGKPVLSGGRDGTKICADAAALLSKVKAQRGEGGKSSGGLVARVASGLAVVGIVGSLFGGG